MNKSFGVLTCGLVLLGLMIALGCTRETESGGGLPGPENSKREAQRTQTLDAKLRHFKRGLESEEGWPITFGGQLLEEIVGMSNAQERVSCLDRFRETFLSAEFSGNDYRMLSIQLGALDTLQDFYLSALFRCGDGLEQNLVFRLDFLKWLRREMARESGVESDDDPRRPGLHVSRDMYQSSLRDTSDIRLRELENKFNDYGAKMMPPDRAEEVRRQIEAFVGRPIRTNAQILHDRMNRPRPASCRSPTEDDVPVSSGL